MTLNPVTVYAGDYLNKIVELFRIMHLRHLMVISQRNSELKDRKSVV